MSAVPMVIGSSGVPVRVTNPEDISQENFTTSRKNKLDAISGINTGDQDLSGKIDKVDGYGLSKNDFSDNYKTVSDKLTPKQVPSDNALIVPSSSYNYIFYTGTTPGGYRHYNAWYFGVETKVINCIGVFIYKDKTVEGALTGDARIQMLLKRGTVVTNVLDATVLNADLLKYNTDVFSGSFKDYECKVQLAADLQILAGDELYINIQVLGGFHYIFGNANGSLPGKEWNDGGSTKLSYRNSDTINTDVGHLTAFPAKPAGSSTYNPIHFYYRTLNTDSGRVSDLEKTVDDLNNKQGQIGKITGASDLQIYVKGITARVITSTGYNYKGNPDTLLMILHGNGQTIADMPSATALAFFAANNITVAIINVQDETAAPFTDRNVGWGNDKVIQRNIDLYNYLMLRYNLCRPIYIAGQSMGMLGAAQLAYANAFPIRCVISIGGVPDMVYMFNNGINRKPAMRQAFGLPSNGSQDANFAAIVQGRNWATKSTFNIAGTSVKIFNQRLYMYCGTADATYSTEFNGDTIYNQIVAAVTASGNFARYKPVAGKNHADPTLWDVAISDGVFYFEMGIVNVGTTAQRPTTLDLQSAGYRYFDTTLNQALFWNGTSFVAASAL